MHIKIKYPHKNGESRVENWVDIKEVLFHEDLLNPDNERIAIGFKKVVFSIIDDGQIAWLKVCMSSYSHIMTSMCCEGAFEG